MTFLNIRNIFFLALYSINLIFALTFTPIFDFGDSPTYIELAERFLGLNESNLVHRSPLFSMFLAILKAVFHDKFVPRLVLLLHYHMVFISSLVLYNLFLIYSNEKKHLARITVFLFNTSLSTIYYSNTFLTEITTIFFFVVSLYFLQRIIDDINSFKSSKLSYIMLGSSLGLLALARYNVIPVIPVFFIFIMYSLLVNKVSFSKSALLFGYLTFFTLLPILIFSSYNYRTYNFFGLFPTGGGISRNVIVYSITESNSFPKEYEEVHNIFLEARVEYYSNKQVINSPNSFSSFDSKGLLNSHCVPV